MTERVDSGAASGQGKAAAQWLASADRTLQHKVKMTETGAHVLSPVISAVPFLYPVHLNFNLRCSRSKHWVKATQTRLQNRDACEADMVSLCCKAHCPPALPSVRLGVKQPLTAHSTSAHVLSRTCHGSQASSVGTLTVGQIVLGVLPPPRLPTAIPTCTWAGGGHPWMTSPSA